MLRHLDFLVLLFQASLLLEAGFLDGALKAPTDLCQNVGSFMRKPAVTASLVHDRLVEPPPDTGRRETLPVHGEHVEGADRFTGFPPRGRKAIYDALEVAPMALILHVRVLQGGKILVQIVDDHIMDVPDDLDILWRQCDLMLLDALGHFEFIFGQPCFKRFPLGKEYGVQQGF